MEPRRAALCTIVFHLEQHDKDDGQIVAEGLVPFGPRHENYRGTWRLPIVGGSGAHAGASGEVEVQTRGTAFLGKTSPKEAGRAVGGPGFFATFHSTP